MDFLTKIGHLSYIYFTKDVDFYLNQSPIGQYGWGVCWSLYAVKNGFTTRIADFVTKDDNTNCYRSQSQDGKLWTEDETVERANDMILCFLHG